ncbi:MAG: FAD-dependent oxidoreductase [Gammaproteobacteria bacterium]|nr:FAD-dependent oxidoreductase [Gammaproteobacteria bacterium]NIR85983.1 FAD-dependent oxidoreductase [Gammaproteobacteria bacterium]NIR91974.1 FAD-dependent oxidoreductase [Gammaproteobacteria bacterium]NIU07224.1 FAD-dependent oxidoreductase [Gammaproteobacteria bacterium]NIV54027.1 FAD-dependent oxidoreductase [Gammaproteobacteria bacterium]
MDLDPQRLELGIPGFTYGDLYDPSRLQDLLEAFDAFLRESDPHLFEEFDAYRSCRGEGMTAPAISDVLVRTAPHVSRFLARLFGVEHTREAQADAIRRDFDPIFSYRRGVVARVEARYRSETVDEWDVAALERAVDLLRHIAFPDAADDPDPERAVSRVAAELLDLAKHYERAAKGKADADPHADARLAALIERLSRHPESAQVFAQALAADAPLERVDGLLEHVRRWTYAALHRPELEPKVRGWVSLRQLKRTDFSHLVEFDRRLNAGLEHLEGPPGRRRQRDGFALTDRRFSERETLFEVDHCIYCHERDTDSCSKGMRRKEGGLRANPLGVTLTGCPLEEKISEAHMLKRDGDNLAALSVIMIDNPMVPGTGHRICNDCMKGCIYQKVEPVDIPQVETNVLTDILFMPWGFEIYSLLTRWNPLNVERPRALPYNGKNVLVVGLGPAGYTLAHYLVNEGFGVVGIDAFKIEPLPGELTGENGGLPQPVRDFSALYEELDERVMAGFGGVAEYGITVRWDKNFLKVIYLTLARRQTFAFYGGVRFGGTLTVDDAWKLGFHHVAIASGAGRPTVIDLKNNLIRGVRKASDFLMALQLTGAAKRSTMTNLQVRLPAIVVGGGLTAIDTATEVAAYYPLQVEKTLARFETLAERFGESATLARYDEEERAILEESLNHGRELRAERERAAAEGRAPDIQGLVARWGGVRLYYRKGLKDSPAYRQNHEEVEKSFEEGVIYVQGMNPLEAVPDEHGHLAAVKFERLEERDGRWVGTGEQPVVAARSLFIAAGTSPNIIYENEHPGTFELENKFFQRYEPAWNGEPKFAPLHDTPVPKLAEAAPFTSYQRDGKHITFFGDNHPVYAGNVVKAMASARDGYPYIVRLFERELAALDPARQRQRDAAFEALKARLDGELVATVVDVKRLTPTIVEVVAHAPMQARKFHPGQFYRIQNLEALAPVVEDTVLAAEGLALTGAWVHKEKGLISLIALEMGTSSRLCAVWQRGEPIVVMGPTGTPTEIPHHSDILLAGGGLGNAVLFSIGKAMRHAGNRVVYFAGYREPQDVFKVREIEEASDVTVWAVDPGPGVHPIPTRRPQDKTFIGNIVEAMVAYAKGHLGETPIRMQDIDHLMVIGSDSMMAAVKEARFNALKPYLKPGHTAIGSINSSMQCMMKGICAQCLCKQVDPQTGEERFVYSCFNQDQPLDWVDFSNLEARLRQNSVQEKLSDQWLDYLFEKWANAEGAERLKLNHSVAFPAEDRL